MNFLIALQTVAVLLAMAIPGFIVSKLKLLDVDKGIKTLSVILLYVCQPFITANAFLNTRFDPKILVNLAFVFLITSVLMTILIFAAHFIFTKEKNSSRRSVYAFASSLGNVGYMAIPFLQALTRNNPEIILYASVSLVGFNLVAWTLGCYLLSGGNKRYISIKRAFLNLPTISFILVLPLFVLNINFLRFDNLDFINNAMALFANMMAPISMTILGMEFSKMKFKEIFNDYAAYISCAIKLIISPLLGWCLFRLCHLFVDLSAIKLNIITLASMPAATLVMMFGALFEADGKAAARAVLLSTLLSIITIPLSLMLLV
ncbi:MAG: AEC family transporter [Christensenellales bacterium]|jgi:predicted permease|nr:hypothetical protein [Clostridiales bacterium]